MKDQYADYETAKMLKQLGYDGDSVCFYEEDGQFKWNNGTSDYSEKANWIACNNPSMEYYIAPLWQQIKQWLWNTHDIAIRLNGNLLDGWVGIPSCRKEFTSCQKDPITAEIEGIKQAVKYLHSKLKQ